ncbi:MAG: peptidase M28 family protein, partial [Flavobacteriales bacterium]
MHYKLLIIIIACFFNSAYSQNDSVFIRQIYNEALSNGESYENLRSLCKDIGARITGSAEAEMAVNWGEKKMNSYKFDKVYKLPVKVPHWERGTKEAGWIKTNKGEYLKVNLLALGGSIGTNGIIDEEVIMFSTLDELKNADATKINGKIVFINQHMDEKQIQTFRA